MFKIIVFGYNENQYLGEGWNERSLVRNTVIARTTSKLSSLTIPVNDEVKELSIIASASVDMIKNPIYGSILVNGDKVGEFRFEDEQWRLLKFQLTGLKEFQVSGSKFKVSSEKEELYQSVGSAKKELKIDVITENAFVVNDYLKNGDMRTFGIHITCLKLM